ncbi:terpene cyclase [Streptomyces sp. WZ.A104]|uniref:terpene synthase family protein n=1 Tax=Streptomyces sp. WZ.A104 TaxID=2023771 RepID=UPI000BBCABE6|nr:terpene cyclase [Streptomyces sp. WZ.A104]PCG82865.1 terpene cyclase [Streptomyces sp. WZ.A104]
MADVHLPVFDIPFPLRGSPHVVYAREVNLERLRSHGMLATDEALEWYLSWDMAQLAGYGYPYAERDELALGVDQMAFFFLFDDQFDGPLGRCPERVAAVCGELTDVLFTPLRQRRRGESPLVAFFGSLWERSVRGMAPSWCARAAHNWEYYLAAYVGEAMDRVGGAVPGMEHFLQVRRGMAGTSTLMDYGERIGGFLVPPAVFHTPQLRMMRQVATDVPIFCNDVYSVVKEEPRGDVDNAVLVVQREQNLCRERALYRVRDLAMARIEVFVELERQLPDVCSALSLGDEGRYAVDRYVDAMKAWMRGYHQWETETHRYAAEATVPPEVPNFAEDLLHHDGPRPTGP